MKAKLLIYAAVAALALALLVIAPLLFRAEPLKPSLSYKVGGCLIGLWESLNEEGSKSSVSASVHDSTIRLLQRLRYVCCAEIVVELQSAEREGEYVVLKVLEKNVGEMCKCICEYSVSIEISNLQPGKYRIEIYGVKYRDMPIEKLWEGVVEV